MILLAMVASVFAAGCMFVALVEPAPAPVVVPATEQCIWLYLERPQLLVPYAHTLCWYQGQCTVCRGSHQLALPGPSIMHMISIAIGLQRRWPWLPGFHLVWDLYPYAAKTRDGEACGHSPYSYLQIAIANLARGGWLKVRLGKSLYSAPQGYRTGKQMPLPLISTSQCQCR